MAQIKAECRSCGGTGLYSGFAEPKGTAVVCVVCNGTGCKTIHYEPFEQRKDRQGIQGVQRSKGTFLGTGVGPEGKQITYKEFRDGKLP